MTYIAVAYPLTAEALRSIHPRSYQIICPWHEDTHRWHPEMTPERLAECLVTWTDDWSSTQWRVQVLELITIRRVRSAEVAKCLAFRRRQAVSPAVVRLSGVYAAQGG